MNDPRVLIIGTGLIGTSIGLALQAAGWQVDLADRDEDSAATAVARGAGRHRREDDPDPDLVLVCVPPRHVVDVAIASLSRWPRAVVTDVASVKVPVLAGLQERAGAALSRFVGGHPMAGREVTGPGGAMPELFRDRPWILTPSSTTEPAAMAVVMRLVAAVGAIPLELAADEHDRAVALTSHTPQVLASLLAARLNAAAPEQVVVSGQGLRDTIRIAGSDPDLWSEILIANAGPVVAELECLAGDLEQLIHELRAGGQRGRAAVFSAVSEGRRGAARLPGKHGAATERYRAVKVAVPDEPGALANLFAAAAAAAVNLEDVRIEHTLGRPTGLVELSVAPDSAAELTSALESGGWSLRA